MSAQPTRSWPFIACCVLGILFGWAYRAGSEQPKRLGVLAPVRSADRMGPEAQAAWQLAQKLGPAVLVFAAKRGTYQDASGQAVWLDGFSVLWYHQGDSAETDGPAWQPDSLESLRKYVANGGGLLLSGAGLAMVHSLGIEPALPRRGHPGKDHYLAELIPVATRHPIFRGLSATDLLGGSRIPITDAGYPAYADFHGSGGPLGGMLLARAASAAENPLVEYGCGKGRIIVLGWRLPHYAHARNAYRANLERLTRNLVDYLADSRQWEKIVRPAGQPARPGSGDVPEGEWRSLELAIRDLIETFQDRYPKGEEYLGRLGFLKAAYKAAAAVPDEAERAKRTQPVASQFRRLRIEALTANPLLDFDRLLVIQRGAGNLGLPANWESNSSLPASGFDNKLCILWPVHPDGRLSTLFEPAGGRFVGDVDLHYDADRMLFSMPGSNGRWQVFEMTIDGKGLRELPLIREPDVDNYDACYLPDGRVLFTSTAPFVGVPCVYGASHVTNLYLLGHDGSIRQLTVDQDHNWCPTVLNNGRVLYLRWEYADLPHSNSRILFHMNPDGTGQMEYFGSNSFFVNSFFYARSIPGHPTAVVGIATGHHGVARCGRLLIVDPARGRREADGVVQEIPGWGKKVEPIIRDNLVDDVWPKFLHPYPLSDKYFLVSAKPAPESLWGVYLVDVFDNMLLLKEVPGYALLEPVPVKKRPRPPILPDRVDLKRKDALVYLSDVYAGPGLRGIPRGAVKSLRLLTYHFSYQGMGGLLGAIGMDGPWDIKRVLGTVPVEPDGSALFRVPANTPIAVQPLDAEGKSLQLMRSWFTAMPGEVLSCAGCHEPQSTGPINRHTIAAKRPASEIAAWYGPVRGFSFAREVQPVLDKYCVSCHDGGPGWADSSIPSLRGDRMITDWSTQFAGNVGRAVGGKFSVAYAELHRFVRRPGIESDIHLLAPMEYHADSTELVQMLRKGHYKVQLDPEAWDRLITWIDLNAPYHGTWTEIVGKAQVQPQAARRRAMRRRYAGVDVDPEEIPALPPRTVEPVVRPPVAQASPAPPCPGWPFGAAEARQRQGPETQSRFSVDLAEGVPLQLVRIPAGQFVMGDPQGHPDEQPACVVKISKPFWIGRFEVTNQQYACFDPGHDSHVEPMHGYQFGVHGYSANRPSQPVVRVSWERAAAFCRWLSAKTGRRFDLPTEAQWEYACRAGTDGPFYYGDLNTDFSRFANLGDLQLRQFALETYIRVRPIPNPNRYDDWIPKDERFDDGGFIAVDVGRYLPNAWGLFDMHGNVWEWTRSLYRPYPYDEQDGRNDPAAPGRRVVRGGSWYDRPKRCTSSFRLAYAPYQNIFNVGFRVVMEED
ncbi:MAG: SUMF1/EgtB/PvdO family nonheme iron enzyme [Thermoguttaceae bacterium]